VRRPAPHAALAVLALALFVVLAVSSLWTRSATFDEGVYIASGYGHLAAADHRLIPVHPPLAKLLAAAPLVMAGARADFRDDSWRDADPWDFAHRLLYRWNDADRVLLLARLPMVGLSALLGWSVFAWTRRHWGLAAGGLALLLFVFSPEVLAHGALATSDLAVTFFVFHAVVAFERLTDRATWPRVWAAGAACGGALASKFTGLVLIPVLAVLALVVALGSRPWPVAMRGWPAAGRILATRRARTWQLAGLFLVMALVSLAAIWAAYGFRYSASGDPAAPEVLAWREDAVPAPVWAAAGLVREERLLPEAYVFGFLDTLRRSRERPAFLMGERSSQGWWYFFPAAFALKTPLALQLLLLLSLAVGWRVAAPWRVELFVLLPAAIYAVFCLTSRVNLGLRYLLPVYPFLFVLAARSARLAAGSRAGMAAVGLLAAWYAASTLRVHPYYLAYFNEAAGGPRHGYRHLVDSSLDWGQDLKGLKRYLDRHRIGRIKLSYFGTADPGYYRIPCDYLPGSMRPAPERLVLFVRPGDVVVVSATNLQGVYLAPAVLPLMDELKAREPIATVGHTLFVYRADFTWLVDPSAAHAAGWIEHALASYAEATRVLPDSPEAYGQLALAWHILGRNRRAVEAFEEALRRDAAYLDDRPEHARAWRAARAAVERRPGS
jgi:4-amino-4-deoxy-L-arabinose transferase-like glycosyltransferase